MPECLFDADRCMRCCAFIKEHPGSKVIVSTPSDENDLFFVRVVDKDGLAVNDCGKFKWDPGDLMCGMFVEYDSLAGCVSKESVMVDEWSEEDIDVDWDI